MLDGTASFSLPPEASSSHMAQGLSMAWGASLLSHPDPEDLRDWICSKSFPRADAELPLRCGPGLQSDWNKLFQGFHVEGQGWGVGVGSSSVSPQHLQTSRAGQRRQSQPLRAAQIPSGPSGLLPYTPPLGSHGFREGHKESLLLLLASFIIAENTSFTWSH